MLGEAKREAALSFPVHLYPWGGESYVDANYIICNASYSQYNNYLQDPLECVHIKTPKEESI